MIKLYKLLFCTVAALSMGSSSAVVAKPVLLKTPIAFSSALPGLGTTIKWVGDRIETASGGAVKMQIYEPNKLIAPFEILDAVSIGKVNSGYTTAAYWTGAMPAAPLFSAVPFGPEAGEYLAWMWYGNGLKLYQEMYDTHNYNVKVLVCGVVAPETSGWFAQEINSIDDLQGLKMRFFGLGGQVMQNLGISTSLLTGDEIYPALEKKAIDATEFSMPAIDQKLGLYKLVKFNYFPGWHQQATIFELLINKDTWNSMDEQQKLLIEMMCYAATANSFAEGEAIQFKVMQDNVENNGVKIRYWSPEMLQALREAWEDVANENAAKNPFFKKVWDDMSKFRAGYDIWEAHGFLPRANPQ